MAEATSDETKAGNSKEKGDPIECAVCLQPCIHPAQLPCGHIFCFLCVKGFANQSKKCAMCRQEIPRDFIEQPILLHSATEETTDSFDGGYQWFYEGRNGWWRYDPRTSEDIEEAFKLQYTQFEILICGETYIIDFQHKFQYPKSCPSRKRYIRRDKIENLTVKGVAGWWQYDERTSNELESSYKNGEKTCELLIAGFLYIIDLENMLQLRRNDPSRRRKIKRDSANIPRKGIAGLRTKNEISNVVTTASTEIHVNHIRPNSPVEGRTDNIVPITPSNTPQSPTSGRESPHQEEDLQATVERISSLRLSASPTRSNAEDSEEVQPSRSSRSLYYRHRSVD